MFFRYRARASAITKSTRCKGTYSLMKLPFHDPIIQCVPDSMHTVKDVLERIFGLLTGKENTEKSRIEEEALGRFTAACSSTPTSRDNWTLCSSSRTHTVLTLCTYGPLPITHTLVMLQLLHTLLMAGPI